MRTKRRAPRCWIHRCCQKNGKVSHFLRWITKDGRVHSESVGADLNTATVLQQWRQQELEAGR